MFRRIAFLVIVLVLVFSAGVSPAAARSETTHFRFQGQVVEARFSSFDETGCIETFVFILAEEGKLKLDGRPELRSFALVSISQFNYCTQALLFDAFGGISLAPDELVIDKKITRATLTTTILVDEFLSATTFPVDLDISWTGVGGTLTEKQHSRINEPGFKINARFMGTFRDAQARGTVTGMGMNFTPGQPAIFAQLGNVKQGDVTIIHTP